jgi:NagD protein
MAISFAIDMDGVIYHGNRLIPGALDFVERLRAGGHKFLFLTNNSQSTPRDFKHKLDQIGIVVDESAFHTRRWRRRIFSTNQSRMGRRMSSAEPA